MEKILKTANIIPHEAFYCKFSTFQHQHIDLFYIYSVCCSHQSVVNSVVEICVYYIFETTHVRTLIGKRQARQKIDLLYHDGILNIWFKSPIDADIHAEP